MCCPPAVPRASSSPLGVYDFQKRSSLIEVERAGCADAGPDGRRVGLWRRLASPRHGRRVPF
jgi:histidinol dehydrogenase